MAPTARSTSPHVSVRPPIAPAVITAYSTNDASRPGDIVPAITAFAPSHSTNTIAPNTSVMTSVVSHARVVVRRTAAAKLVSTLPRKRVASAASCVNAWTVDIALRISPASADESAMRSWLVRDSRAHAPTEHDDRHDHEREEADRDQEQLDARNPEHRHAADEQERVAQPERHARADDRLDQRRVGRQP